MPRASRVKRIVGTLAGSVESHSSHCFFATVRPPCSPSLLRCTLTEVRTTHAASTVSSELAAVNERARAAAADAAALHEQLDAAHRLRARDALEWQRVCGAFLGGALTRDELAAHVAEKQQAALLERQAARAQLERYQSAAAAAQADVDALTAAQGGGSVAASSPAPPGGAL